jgi:ParB-like nuclease domain
MTQQESSPDFRMDVVPVSLAGLRPYPKNPRTHSKKQIRQIADSIRRFGFTNPVLVSDDDEIVAGHGRVEAAKLLQMTSVPAVRLSHLTAAQRRAYVIADNKLALNSGWDHELLAVELQALVDLDFGVEITGFSLAEVDLVLEEARNSGADPQGELADETPGLPEPASATTRSGDLWLLDRHRLLCGDARRHENFDRLLEVERMDLVFTDPPYNVPIDGHVCGLGRIRHREFAMGAGEMELCANLGDGVDQAADISCVSCVATSIPSRDFTPRTTLGN